MFLDFGAGIIIATVITSIFQIDLSVSLLIFSIAVAVLPDIDFLYFYPKRGDTKHDHKHRDFIHYPLIYLPVGTIFFWLLLGPVWGIVFFFSSFFHFFHDSIGIGWGIKWLYPFSQKSYSFFYLYSRKERRGLRKILFSFSDQQRRNFATKHGDPDWIKNIYFKWHPIAIVEFMGFIIGFIILYIYVW